MYDNSPLNKAERNTEYNLNRKWMFFVFIVVVTATDEVHTDDDSY